MKPVEIVFLVIGIVLAVILFFYLVILTVDLVFFFSFKSYWKKHKKGLEVVLKMKHENLIRILDIFKTNKIQVDNRIRQTLLDMDPKCFAELDTEESKKCRNDLSVIRDEIFYIANQNGHIVVNEEFLLAKENVLEQDVLFRKCLAMYNADVLGYNYWAQFKPCRFIYKFFKVKEKEII